MLDSHAGSKGSPWTGIALSPRALAEPGLNHWLASMLPLPEDIVCRVHRSDTDSTTTISVRDLGLQPIDLLFSLRMEGAQAMQDLDDRILQYAIATAGALRADTEWTIRYTELVSAPQVTLFQLAPLMESLRKLTLSSRALKASDMSLHNEASEEQDSTASINLTLVTDASSALQGQLPALDGYIRYWYKFLRETTDTRWLPWLWYKTHTPREKTKPVGVRF